ncbi:MAG: hypothetical protein II574_11475 [Ruminococcus sp.]|nr:hypothetical protein [Ruminococcus sp.]
MKLLKKEPVRRALRTFVQAVAGYVTVNVIAADLSTKNAIAGFIAAAIAAGIAAAMNIENGDDNDAV